MALSIGELFVELGFDVDLDKLKAFDDKLNSARNQILEISAAATAGVYAIDKFLETPISRASQYKQFTDQLGYASQGLQEWARVASTVNNTVTFDQAASKYRAFAEYVQKAKFGGGGQALEQLGVQYDPNKGPDQLMEELSNAARSGKWQQTFHENWRSAVMQLLPQIGLGTDYIDALMTSAQQRANMTKGFILSDDDIAKLDKVNTSIHQIGRDWEKFAQDMALKYGDRIIAFLKSFEEEVEKLAPKIDHFVKALGGWVHVGEAILALWGGAKMIAILNAIITAAGAVASLGGALATGAGAVAATGVGTAVVGGAAAAAGAAVPVWLDQKYHWGNDFAGWLDKKLGKNNDVDQLVARLGDYITGGHAYTKPPQPKVEHLFEQNNNITINSKGDPEDTAREFQRVLDDQTSKMHQNAYNQLNLGANR